MKGYCLNCKKLVEMLNVIEKKLKNGDIVYQGKCQCGEIIIKRKVR